MLALLYDIHGNLPALEAVLDDAAGRGVDRWLLGGDMAPFGAWPAETVQRLRDLENAEWIRGNTERWMVDPIPAVEPMAVAVQAARDALGYAVADELGALPESAALGDTVRAWHGSPVSDVQSFLPEPGEDEDELLIGVTDSRLYFGHTHLQFRRTAEGPNGPVELVNPGSVGMPFDGDHRAAYALLHEDGTIEHRRVAYDHASVPAALRERYGDAPWHERALYRFTHARLEAG
jgi:predicted phosphodiesterase